MSTFILHSIELTDVRGIDHLRLDGIPETGVVVIHGDNEAGKSTILDALNVVLTEKHTGRKQSTVMPLQPSGKDVGPEIKAGMTVGPYEFTIMKRFLRKAAAELHITKPRVEQLSGRAADERLEQILAEHLDTQLMDTLFLRQDELGHAVAAVGIPSLTQALDDHSDGNGSSVVEDTDLMQAVEAEYHKYFTKTGRPTGSYAALDKEVDSAKQTVAEAQSEFAKMETYVSQYEGHQRTLTKAETDLPAAQVEVKEREESYAQGAKAAEAFESAQAVALRAEQDVERAESAVQQRTELHAVASEAQADVEALVAQLAPLKEKVSAEQTEATEIKAELDGAQDALQQARVDVRAALDARSHAAARRRVGEIDERLKAIGDAVQALEKVKVKVSQRGKEVTDNDVRRVEDLAGELLVARRVYESAAAKMELAASADVSVQVDDAQLQLGKDVGPEVVELRQGTQFIIGDVTLTYQAGADSSAEDLANNVDDVDKRLAKALEELQCADVDQVRAKRDEHRELALALDSARRELALVQGKDDPEELETELATLQQELGDDSVEFSSELLESAERAEKAAREIVEELNVRLEQLKQSPAALSFARHEVKVDNARMNWERAKLAVEKAVASASDEDLNKALAAAQSSHAAAAEQLSLTRDAYVAADVETAEKLLAGSRAHLETVENTIRKSALEIKGLESYIESSMGVAEKLDNAQAALRVVERRAEAERRRAEAAAYLYELLVRHRDEAHARYTAPFAQALGTLAKTVYGGDVSFELGDDLAVAQRVRNGVAVPVEQLSGGAKEQLAILTRFAIADLLAQGSGDVPGGARGDVPVVIDDALGSTDSTRLELMSALFTDAGRNGQVIVLTCMPERYSRIPGRTEISMNEIKGTGQ